MSNTRNSKSEAAIKALVRILGRSHVLTSARSTAPYVHGNRFGTGDVLAVLRPGSLADIWRALQVCVDNNFIVIPQAANTGLTGGSGPGDQSYDREIVIISTTRIKEIYLINDAREAVCLAGSTLYELEDALAEFHREPHSVIGSTSIGASVIGGISNNSGGSQVRKGPAYTEHAAYARVNQDGKLELLNHLGIDLGNDPVHILDRLQRGDWTPSDVTPPPEDSRCTEYANHVRKIVPSPARYNADPHFLYEASGSAGKIMTFAARVRTFPKDEDTTTFYIGTNSPASLENLRRLFLRSGEQLPISGEYMGRGAFDLAEEYGRDTFMGLKYAGTSQVRHLFALKGWANGVLSRFPFLGETPADSISQKAFSLLPSQIPKRMMDFRDRFEHYLLVEVSESERQQTQEMLMEFFREKNSEGAFFVCDKNEAKSAMLIRFGAASAMTRYFNMNRESSSDMITFDVALRRDDIDWLETLPPEVTEKLSVSSYYGHFFCHVMHQDHVAKKGVDPVELKKQMMSLLEERGAVIPAEHNYGRLYHLPPELEAHFKELDPCNIFNPGIGKSSPHKNWA